MKEVTVESMDRKSELPIHMMISTSGYARIKTESLPRSGDVDDPGAQSKALTCAIMSQGKELELNWN